MYAPLHCDTAKREVVAGRLDIPADGADSGTLAVNDDVVACCRDVAGDVDPVVGSVDRNHTVVVVLAEVDVPGCFDGGRSRVRRIADDSDDLPRRIDDDVPPLTGCALFR